jgi:predicted dithiol-disulfide oxidoreductase (DUF899 family)
MGNQESIEQQISVLEETLKASKEKLAALRRTLPPTEVKNHVFKNSFGNETSLSQLFGTKKELIVIHNMGKSCPYCTLWADGFNGVLKHLEDRAAFVIESMDEPSVQRQFAMDRGWAFKMVSSRGTSFKKEMGYADDKDSPSPGVSVFSKRDDGKIFRVSTSALGPGDNFCIVWDFFDLLPQAWTGEEIDFFYSQVK